ncbi:Two-component sensor histidine kinase, contains HisKA and HATPase domains [Devosia lucknowensis]|uniref:histidine kinase n=1 Tax=Devosia lucknowensis TaxID=1096929 RepID=A0A1Y6G7S3_9HYPH|nr:sensor histidine kinase [Devosia lucknowensis]SMQ85804.1 Two-component sensor histidine kinase, contains HisKA and HATPase domains [Devosia lucknowensis]
MAVDTAPGKSDARVMRGRPIAVYLIALVLAILIPAMAVALVLLNSANDSQQKVLAALTNATVQAMGHAVDREITGMATTLRVLSSSESLELGDLAAFHERALTALAGSGSYLIAVDDQFRQLLNTRVPYGEVLQQTSDIPTAERALERGVATISPIFFGAVAQDYVFNVWLPLSDVEPVRLVTMTQNARNLAPSLQSRQLPAGWHAALVDTNNAVISSTADTALEIGSILPIRQWKADVPGDAWAQEELNGERVVTAEWRSGYTGWRVIAWAASSQVQKPLQDSVLQLTLWGLFIAVCATAVAFLIAQRISSSVRGLRLDAQRMGRGEAVYPRTYPVTEIAEVSQALAEASEQRQIADRDIRFLMRELAHRSKNQMAVIAAMAKQTARGATDIQTYVVSLERRIMGLARSTDLLLANGRAGVMLAELIEQQIGPFRPPEADRVKVEGPDLRINPQGAQILGMALHELATNATRYGAFAEPTGRLDLTWRMDAENLSMRWREHLGRALVVGERSGFGTIVLRTMVGGALGAQVNRDVHGDGVEWIFEVPLTALDPSFAAVRPDEPDPQA